MANPPRLQETPTQQDIENGLKRLCTNALRTYWILEKEGKVLLGLDCVRAYLVANPTKEKDYVVALRKYLDDAIERVESPQHRVILEIVLGAGDNKWKAKKWRHEKAKARRAEAGRRFRPEDGKVTPGTIRQHHEPRAIHELAEIVWRDELQARGESPEN